MSSVLTIDDYALPDALEMFAAYGTHRFGYVVTPNVDHIIRHHDDPQFRALYSQAAYVLLDSRFLAHMIGLIRRKIFRVCLGSELTAAMLSKVVAPNDVAVLVGGPAEQAQFLRNKYGLRALRHIDPPMNFIRDPAAVEQCLRAIEAASPFRFCFLAIGSPQQEIIAQKLKERGIARGLALCIGAAVNFMTGVEKRAPRWMQLVGFEWLYRLLQNPRRMAKRYLLRGPRIFWLLPRLELRARRSAVSAGELIEFPPTVTNVVRAASAAPLTVPTTQIIGRPGQAA
jgi:exopolysaccharide biosynthesis WecB/TagA/CpsF family protein